MDDPPDAETLRRGDGRLNQVTCMVQLNVEDAELSIAAGRAQITNDGEENVTGGVLFKDGGPWFFLVDEKEREENEERGGEESGEEEEESGPFRDK